MGPMGCWDSAKLTKSQTRMAMEGARRSAHDDTGGYACRSRPATLQSRSRTVDFLSLAMVVSPPDPHGRALPQSNLTNNLLASSCDNMRPIGAEDRLNISHAN
jgi:hypothetical protein